MSKTEKQLARLDEARQLWQEQTELRRQHRFDDFMFLVKSGTSAAEATRRVGTTPEALTRQAYRWNRLDIVRVLTTPTRQQRQQRQAS